MNNKKIVIIHPKDETTDFLEEITSYLLENTVVEIVILRLATKDDHLSFFETVQTFKENELILFLGHGTSTGLSGCSTNECEQQVFIAEKQLKVFENKNLILLSCRSNQYLKSYFKDCKLKSAIGFPNLITDFEEVIHHDDPSRLEDITEDDVEAFKIALVEIVKFSLVDFVNSDLTVFQIFNRIKLRLNRKIVNLYQRNVTNDKTPLGKMLHDIANDLNYFNNHLN
ncbi:hypothetical protein [Flavobacterium pedocola]